MTPSPLTPLATLLADLYQVFACHEAQAKGVAFDREMTALWARGLRDLCILVLALERRQSSTDAARLANVIDLTEVFAREQAARRVKRCDGEPA